MRRTVAAVMGVVFLAGGSALAHHSYADFLLDQTVSIEGEVEAFLYGNLTPNEKRVAEDRRDCCWLYVATRCKTPASSRGAHE